MDNAADAVPIADLLDERCHLLDVARWMLGSAQEAESAVEEAYRRWFALSDVERARRRKPLPWLVRATGSICLARLTFRSQGSPTVPRSSGRGVPPSGPGRARGALESEIREILRYAMDALTPTEQATFVLNDVFAMAPRTIADIVGTTQPECEELADRARRSVRDDMTRPTPPEVHDALVRDVLHACLTGNAALLTSLLAPDATAFFDGGGKIRALVQPVHGGQQVTHGLLGLLPPRPCTALTAQPVNGRTGLVVRYNGQVAAVISFDATGHHVTQVWAVLNPDKLRSWNRRGRRPAPDYGNQPAP